MDNALQRTGFWRWLLGPQKMDFATWEMLLMRLGFAWVMLTMGFILDEPSKFPSIPYPNGVPVFTQWLVNALHRCHLPYPGFLDHFLTLDFLRDVSTVHFMSASAKVCLILGMAGVAEPLTLGWLLFVIVTSKSYNQSQGNLGHAGQLVTLCLLAQWLATLRALLPDASGWKGLFWAGPTSWRRQTWWMLQALAAGYTVSAITKLVNSHGMWPFRGNAFILQIYKAQTESLVTHDAQLGALTTSITDFITQNRWFATIMLIPTWLLEFGAFVVLINRRLALLMGLCLIGFHHMTNLMMSIPFMEHRYMLWIFVVNPVYWVVAAGGWIWKKRTASS